MVPVGVPLGYLGLCRLADADKAERRRLLVDLTNLDHSRWMREGGTMLGSRRHNLTRIEGALTAAVAGAELAGLDALIILGGDGSLRGALALAEQGIEVVGIPKTIDRDVGASEDCIGYASAIEIGTELTERVATSARSHGLTFLIEVMGRRSGALAAAIARCTGADGLLVPEHSTSVAAIVSQLGELDAERGSVIILAEGFWPLGLPVPDELRDARGRARIGEASRAIERVLTEHGISVRSARLGHTVRGGRPNAADRLLAHRLAHLAADSVGRGEAAGLAVLRGGRPMLTSLREAALPRRVLADSELGELRDLLW